MTERLSDAAAMWRRVLIVGQFLSLCACQRTETASAQSYQSATDQWIVRLGLPAVGILPCRNSPYEGCYKLEPEQRWRGTWVTDEGGRFCPKETKRCHRNEQPHLRLWYNPKVFTHPPPVAVKINRTYELNLVGRRTEYPVGGWQRNYVIVVDRLDSMTDLGPLPNTSQEHD